MEANIVERAYLQFIVKALGLVNMWPQEKISYCPMIKKYYTVIIIIATSLAIVADMISQFYEDKLFLTRLSENIIALSALYGVTYISICFITTNRNIKVLVEDLAIFETYSPISMIQKADNSARFYTKLFITYGIIGNICYGLMPFVNYNECSKNRSSHMLKYGIPCGLVIRLILPFKIDYSPWMEIVALEEVAVCTLCTTIIIMVTMLICGILIHVTTHLKHLKSLILQLSPITESERLLEEVQFCVKFHTAIIDKNNFSYATRADSLFSQMMLLHVTLTGFIISVLVFEITTTVDAVEAVRFAMHLTGWLGMLFLICYYGQTLMDESFYISKSVYSFTWYEKSVTIQKYAFLMLLRSQKPLTLKASSISEMSLATFLAVLYSAYSYFTLLLKLKS